MWHYNNKPLTEIPDGYTNFVYLITNNNTGKQYIGKKTFYNKTKKLNKSTGRYSHGIKESDWGDYWGSSKTLLQDITDWGEICFDREIIHLCRSKGKASYLEAREIIIRDAIINDHYYNESLILRVSRSHIK